MKKRSVESIYSVTIHKFASLCLVSKVSIYYLDSPVAISPSSLSLSLMLSCFVECYHLLI
jgi:hypothetical protein